MDAAVAISVEFTSSLQQVIARVATDGGFGDRAGGPYRPDATAWAILALDYGHPDGHLLRHARSRLASGQREDGRVCISPDHPEASWPTSLSVLAWEGSPVHHEACSRAVRFLLEHEGYHWKKSSDDSIGHDTTLRGWPWIDGTHSWVEPTALSVRALVASGHGDHRRVQEAIRLILDRQLPHGGWNYGNTLVFGRELHPMPESTGAALAGLSEVVGKDQVARSLAYLEGEVNRLRTPVSLGWSLLGLAAWNRWPSNGTALVERCLANQSRYGDYDTSALCLLLLGALTADAQTTTALFSRPRGIQGLASRSQ
jgi:hypothetical protein